MFFYQRKYRYARPFTAACIITDKPLTKKIINNQKTIEVDVFGIPDGVKLTSARSTTDHEMKCPRLNIFSDVPLPEIFQETIDGTFGHRPYPLPFFMNPTAQTPLDVLPIKNFYTLVNRPQVSDPYNPQSSIAIGDYIGYRYLQQRHTHPTIYWDGQNIYPFVYPHKILKEKITTVLIMPENFVQTSLYTGFFNFNNLIYNVFSKYPLSSGKLKQFYDLNDITRRPENFSVTLIRAKDSRTYNNVALFLSKIGLHNIVSNDTNQIYAADKYLTVVVGSLADIALPSTD